MPVTPDQVKARTAPRSSLWPVVVFTTAVMATQLVAIIETVAGH